MIKYILCAGLYHMVAQNPSIASQNLHSEITSPAFQIIPYGEDEYEAAMLLRSNILQKPLEQICHRDEEVQHIHVVGYLDSELCASAALVPDQESLKMQRVVVRTDLQYHGIGSSLLKYCEAYAKTHNFKNIYCYSRVDVIPFYLKNGYEFWGPVTYKNDIPHQRMRKPIL